MTSRLRRTRGSALIVALGVLMLVAMMALVFVTDALSTLHTAQTADLQRQAALVARELIDSYINYNLKESDPGQTRTIDTDNDGTPDAAEVFLPPGVPEATAQGFKYSVAVQTFLLTNRININAHGDGLVSAPPYGSGYTPYEISISDVLQNATAIDPTNYDSFSAYPWGSPNTENAVAAAIVRGGPLPGTGGAGLEGRYGPNAEPGDEGYPAAFAVDDDPDKLPNPMTDHIDNDADGQVDELGAAVPPPTDENLDEPAEFNPYNAKDDDVPYDLSEQVDILLNEPFKSRIEQILANTSNPADPSVFDRYRHVFTTRSTATIINKLTGNPRLGLNWVAHRLAVDLYALRDEGVAQELAGQPTLGYDKIVPYLEAATEFRDELYAAFQKHIDHVAAHESLQPGEEDVLRREARRRANQITVNLLDFVDDDTLSKVNAMPPANQTWDPTAPDDRYLSLPKVLYDLPDGSIAVKDRDGALYHATGGTLDTPVTYGEPAAFDGVYFGVDRHAFINELYIVNRERNGIDDEGDWNSDVMYDDDHNLNGYRDPDWDGPASDDNGDLNDYYDPEGTGWQGPPEHTGIDGRDLAYPARDTIEGEENVYFIELANIYPEPLDVTGYIITYTKKDGLTRGAIKLTQGPGGERFVIPPADYSAANPEDWDFGYLVICSHARDFDGAFNHVDLEFGRDSSKRSVFLRAPLPPGVLAPDTNNPIYDLEPVPVSVPAYAVKHTIVVDRQKTADGAVTVEPDLPPPPGYAVGDYPSSLIEKLVSHSVERIDPRVAWVVRNDTGQSSNWDIPGWAGAPAPYKTTLDLYDFHTIADLATLGLASLHDEVLLGDLTTSPPTAGTLGYTWVSAAPYDGVTHLDMDSSNGLPEPFGWRNSPWDYVTDAARLANVDWFLSYQYKMPATIQAFFQPSLAAYHDFVGGDNLDDLYWNTMGPKDVTAQPFLTPWAFRTVAALGDLLVLPGALDVNEDGEFEHDIDDDVYYTNVSVLPPPFPPEVSPPPPPGAIQVLGNQPQDPKADLNDVLPACRLLDPYDQEYGFLYDYLTVNDPLHDGLDNDGDWNSATDDWNLDGLPSRDWDGPNADSTVPRPDGSPAPEEARGVFDYDPEPHVDEADEINIEGKININVETGSTLGYGPGPSYTVDQLMVIGAGPAILDGLPFSNTDFINSIIGIDGASIINCNLNARPVFKRMFDIVKRPVDSAGHSVNWPVERLVQSSQGPPGPPAPRADDDGDGYRDEQDERNMVIGAIMNLVTPSASGGDLRNRADFYGIKVTVFIRDPNDQNVYFDSVTSPPPVAVKTVLAVVVSVPGAQPRVLYTCEPVEY